MDRLFLDSNVLFSAAHSRWSQMGRLWWLGDVELISSSYAAAEARRNLADKRPESIPLLDSLISGLAVVVGIETTSAQLPDVAGKDAPILAAAVDAEATHLLTGDRTHFGHLFGTRVVGVLIMPPGEYLRGRADAADRPED